MIKNGDTLVLAGRIPQGVKEEIYEEICKKIDKKEVRIVVDATGDTLVKTLKYHPFLIKPNQYELGEIFGIEISNQDEAIKYAKKLQQKGAQNVLVSMGSKGAILIDENGKAYKRKALNTNVIQNLVLENREKLSISGVLDVLSFDDQIVIVETELGLLSVKGENLRINKLSIDTSEVVVEGDIFNLSYSEKSADKKGGSLIGKIFK